MKGRVSKLRANELMMASLVNYHLENLVSYFLRFMVRTSFPFLWDAIVIY